MKMNEIVDNLIKYFYMAFIENQRVQKHCISSS